MLWQDRWLEAKAGYTFKNSYRKETQLNFGGPAAYRYDNVVCNIGVPGKCLYLVAENVDNKKAACYAWYFVQPSPGYINVISGSGATDCPCSLNQCQQDRRFRRKGISNNIVCYKQRMTSSFLRTSISFHTQCCFDVTSGSLINTYDKNNVEPLTTTYLTQKYNYLLLINSWQNRRNSRKIAESDDEVAYDNCCIKSRLCHLYEEKRPIRSCRLYQPDEISMF